MDLPGTASLSAMKPTGSGRKRIMAVASSPVSAPPGDDMPRHISARPSASDRMFRGILRSAGIAVLTLTALILVFLILQSIPAFRAEGFRFFTTSALDYGNNQFGIAALLPDSVLIALIALVIAFPAGIAAAVYISEYAPSALRRPLIAVMDLLAAIPSIAFALWGLFYLMPRMPGTASWLAHHLGFIPIFNFPLARSPSCQVGSSLAPSIAPACFVGSTFIAGIVVSLMVIPIIASLSRQVFSQAPQGEREAAYALGSTRWGMVRTVVLPFGRAGVIGASMLGLGRALGETIAVSFIITPPEPKVNVHVLEYGGNSITAQIANQLFSWSAKGRSDLLAAGLVLFVLTLVINTLASVVISRSRSGASTAAD
jgi:phosphate transport system permease protein